MKKFLVCSLTLSVLLAFCSCAKEPASQNSTNPAVENTDSAIVESNSDESEAPDAGLAGIANPVVEMGSLDELKQTVGFEMAVPEAIEGYATVRYDAINSELAEVIFTAEDNEEILIRKQKTEDTDISGIYIDFAEENEQTVNGVQALFKGSEGKVHVAVWNSGDYAFSVYASKGLTSAEMLDLCAQVK